MATGKYKNYYTVTYPDNAVFDGSSNTVTIKRPSAVGYKENFIVEVAILGMRLAYSESVAYPANAAQATFTFALTAAQAQYMTMVKQTLTISIMQHDSDLDNSGWEGYKSTATVPQTSAPTFSLSYNEAATGVPSGWGYTQNISKLAAYITGAAGKYGASISSYKLTFAGFTSAQSNMTTGVLTAAGTFALTATVTDSRGMSTTKTASISVRDYQFPTIVSASCSRCNASGAADEEGTSAKIICDYTNTTAGGLNTVTTALQYRVSGATTWTTVAGGFADNAAKVVAGTFGTDSQYEFMFTVTDKVTSVSRSAVLDMAFFTMDFLSGGQGIAFGKPSTRAGFDCAMAAYFKNVAITTPLPVGSGGTGGATQAAARAGIGALGAANANGYWGMTRPDGNTGAYIRTTIPGLLPYQSGGHGTLGTSSWPFNQIWGNNLYNKGNPAYGAKVLYNNGSGAAPTITLNETCANFTLIDIIYGKLDGTSGGYKCLRIYAPNGKRVILDQINPVNTQQTAQMITARVRFSGTQIVNEHNAYTINAVGGRVVGPTVETGNIRVYVVIGYK